MSTVVVASPAAASQQNILPEAKVRRWWASWHKFTQRRLRVWQPILAPRFVIPLYLVAGLSFVVLGVALLINAGLTVELSCDYTDVQTNDHGVGFCDFTVGQTMEGPIWVQYSLGGFFQNHRRYVKSYSPGQLAHTQKEDNNANTACEPAINGRGGRRLYPCGLVATSVFNDSFALTRRADDGSWKRLDVASDAAAIAWPSDLAKFKNVDPEAASSRRSANGTLLQQQVDRDMWILDVFPPVECEQVTFRDDETVVPVRVATKVLPGPGDTLVEVPACAGYFTGQPVCEFTRNCSHFKCEGPDYRLVPRRSWGVESGHLLVWMRIAGLPSFKKLWGRIDETLPAETQVRLYFVDNYPVKQFGGRKSVLLTAKSSVGGPRDYLGYGSLALGCCCLLVTLVWKLLRIFYRPRLLGDISYLTPEKPARRHEAQATSTE